MIPELQLVNRSRIAVATTLVWVALFAARPAFTTWSIVAVDQETKEVGSAGASCTGFVAGIVGLAPGHGVIVAQAQSNSQARRHGVRMLLDGASPREVIVAIANVGFDPHFQKQQYGVAALGFESAPGGFTGSDTVAWQGHATADGVAVQGNILTGPEVVKATLAAFRENASSSLAERLLVALEAGRSKGGDKRCGQQGALSAYLVVAGPEDPPKSPRVKIIVVGQKRGGEDPVQIVRRRFESE